MDRLLFFVPKRIIFPRNRDSLWLFFLLVKEFLKSVQLFFSQMFKISPFSVKISMVLYFSGQKRLFFFIEILTLLCLFSVSERHPKFGLVIFESRILIFICFWQNLHHLLLFCQKSLVFLEIFTHFCFLFSINEIIFKIGSAVFE